MINYMRRKLICSVGHYNTTQQSHIRNNLFRNFSIFSIICASAPAVYITTTANRIFAYNRRSREGIFQCISIGNEKNCKWYGCRWPLILNEDNRNKCKYVNQSNLVVRKLLRYRLNDRSVLLNSKQSVITVRVSCIPYGGYQVLI